LHGAQQPTISTQSGTSDLCGRSFHRAGKLETVVGAGRRHDLSSAWQTVFGGDHSEGSVPNVARISHQSLAIVRGSPRNKHGCPWVDGCHVPHCCIVTGTTHTRKVRSKGFQDSAVIADSRHLFPLPQASPGAHVAPFQLPNFPTSQLPKAWHVYALMRSVGPLKQTGMKRLMFPLTGPVGCTAGSRLQRWSRRCCPARYCRWHLDCGRGPSCYPPPCCSPRRYRLRRSRPV